jgi:MFS family permease
MMLAILPSYVHLKLGFSTIIAGLMISAQYVATVVSRPQAGRMADKLGAKRIVVCGLLICALSGAFSLVAAWQPHLSWISLGSLFAGRLALGVGESMAALGSIVWGIGRTGPEHTAKVISWNGISTYGGLATGAPLGVLLLQRLGFGAVGLLIVAVGLVAAAIASRLEPVATVPGKGLPFRKVFWRVAPHGIGLALGGIGFGVIATFVTLFYSHQHWNGAAFSLSLFGLSFIGARLAFSHMINRLGGFPVAIVSFVVECIGLVVLGLSRVPAMAFAGAALTGFGFSLVFPALGVEAVRRVPLENRGTALGAYNVFIDFSLFLTGPAAGAVIGRFGYPAAFLVAAGAVAAALGLTSTVASQSRTRDHGSRAIG